MASSSTRQIYPKCWRSRAFVFGYAALGVVTAWGWSHSPVVFAAEENNPAIAAKNDSLVQMNFPQEIEIKALVDYVSERLKINILYDQELTNKKVTIRAPEKIPISSLMSVLESALKMKGLAIVDADTPGWKRIVSAKALPSVAPTGTAAEAIERFGKGVAVTQAFVLKQAPPEQVNELIKPFLTETGANSIALPQFKTLIITDYATNLMKIAHWIELLDQPKPETVFEFVPVENMLASGLISQVATMLASKAKASGAGKSAGQLEMVEDARTNRILLIGSRTQIDEARQFIAAVDVPLKATTKTYSFKNTNAATIDRLMQQMVAARGGSWHYRAVVDPEQNTLMVTATDEVHQQLESLKASRDGATSVARSPIQFYKVKNLPVNGLLETIRSLERDSDNAAGKSSNWRQLPTDGRIRAVRQEPLTNGTTAPTTSNGDLAAANAGASETTGATGGAAAATSTAPTTAKELDAAASAGGQPMGNRQGKATLPSEEGTATAGLLGRARVTADVQTNTLIVVAEPAVQRLYAELIEKLDQRRAQVLVEAKFVLIDTSNDFSLGVEISAGGQQGAKKLFAFGSYGLSTVNATTGALSLIPGTGFNGTLVDPDVADVVVRALSKSSRARVASSPRILINDNASGQLTSVQEVPYSSVNASQTVATTTFAGFADAGTTITVTPHITDDSRLQLDLRITLNSFTGSASNNLPPPRQTQEVSSQITIPDGHTAIVGGLNLKNTSYGYTGIPYLEQIPVVRELTGITTNSRSSSSMFVFLRPIILKDDKFCGLKYLSEEKLRQSGSEQDYPASEAIWIPSSGVCTPKGVVTN